MYGGLSPASGESMLTGSPQSGSYPSPTNLPISGSPKAPFLPPYLLGHQSTPVESQRSYQHYPASVISPSGHGHHHVTWSPDLIQRIPSATTPSINRFGGPPVRSLEVVDNQRRDHSFSIPLERLDSTSLNTSPSNVSAAQVDPFYTQGDDFDPSADMDDTWVTVFGFPPDAANYILKEFSTYGTIVQHEFSGKGNWVHIRYQSSVQAKKALAKNGHLYAQNTIRIGVSQCIDKDILRRYRSKHGLSEIDNSIGSKRLKTSTSASRLPKPDAAPVSSLLFTRFDTSTPVRPSPLANLSRLENSATQNGSPITDLNRSSRLGSMRSLAAAYDHGGNISNQPQQQSMANGSNGNLLTKAWKYIFSQ